MSLVLVAETSGHLWAGPRPLLCTVCLELVWFLFLFFSWFYLFIWVSERERERVHAWVGGGAEAEGEADSPLSREPNMRVESRTLRSWPELTAVASPTEVPRCPILFLKYLVDSPSGAPWAWNFICPLVFTTNSILLTDIRLFVFFSWVSFGSLSSKDLAHFVLVVRIIGMRLSTIVPYYALNIYITWRAATSHSCCPWLFCSLGFPGQSSQRLIHYINFLKEPAFCFIDFCCCFAFFFFMDFHSHLYDFFFPSRTMLIFIFFPPVS